MRRPFWYCWMVVGLAGVCFLRPCFASGLSEVLFTRGLMSYEKGDFESAVVDLREAALRAPANLMIRKYLFSADAKAAHRPSAIVLYQEAVDGDPFLPRHHLELAVALYFNGEMDRALAALETANQLSPGNGEILFFMGLVRLKKGLLQEAIEDLREARRLDSRLRQGALFYEAVGLYHMRDRTLAKTLFRKVISADPFTDYARQAAGYLGVLAVRRFSAELTTGLAYDTNVIIQGDKNTLGVQLDVPDKEQLRVPFSALLDYRFLDLGRWSLGARYHLFASVHDESNDLNGISNLGEVYGVWRNPKWYIRPFYYYRNLLLDTQHYSDTHALGGSIMYFAPYNLAPELYFRWQRREYHFSTTEASDPDGANFRGEFNQYFYLPGRRGNVRAGVGGEGHQSEGGNLDYTSLLAVGGFQYQLPWGTWFDFDFEYRDRSYQNVHTVFGKKRDDTRYYFAWELGKDLSDGFQIRGRVIHIRNDSNIGDYDYDRQIYSVLLSWRY